MKKIIAIILIWIACGIVNWGFVLGDFTHDYPYQDNRWIAAYTSIFGPMGTIAIPFCVKHWEWQFKPLTVSERWREFKLEFGDISTKRYEGFCKGDRTNYELWKHGYWNDWKDHCDVILADMDNKPPELHGVYPDEMVTQKFESDIVLKYDSQQNKVIVGKDLTKCTCKCEEE